MESNKIEGVKPFNEFFFRNCFWHQLIAGVSCLGISEDKVLVNHFVFAKENFGLDESGILPTKEFEKFFGYRCRHCGVTERSLVENVDRGRPMLVGVDCFFLESRTDTYQKLHDPHFVMVYGYDRAKRLAFVVDHNYKNGFDFTEKIISLDNVLLSNRMYKKYIRHTRYTSRVLYLTKQGRQTGNVLGRLDGKRLAEGRKNSQNNLRELRRMLIEDIGTLEKKAEAVSRYLQEIRTSLNCLAKAGLFREKEERKILIAQLINGYSYLVSLVLKMERQNNFAYALKWRGNIIRKLDEVEETEKKVYDLLSEGINENI